MSYRGEVLVAIINNRADFALAMEQHWYRVPVSSQEKWLADRWPPKWLALYQTKKLGLEPFTINYFARVLSIHRALRWQLFPNEPRNKKSERLYYQLVLEPLIKLPQPIYSSRRRRIIFLTTTWKRFSGATEINDLYVESSLEEKLWAALRQHNIRPERQELVTIEDRNYFLDFAVYCASGKIDIETDGDEWHATPEKAELDNLRDNDLESTGWQSLRFTSYQIDEQAAEYCVPIIVDTINHLGGLEEVDKFMPRKINPDMPGDTYQPSLFDGV
jgi:very-short-patch-repair endonuclease